MKDMAFILCKNNNIVKRKIKNPQKGFDLEYQVDGEKKSMRYHYDRNKTFILPGFLRKIRVSFYEEGNPEPLSAKFENRLNDAEVQQFYTALESKLFAKLADSTKDKGADLSIGLVLGLAGIAGMVLIVMFG